MNEPSLESLFERYREQGELDALGVVFDRTAPELLVLAAHLVRDPVEAEDLVQTTFVAVIEGARSFESGRRLEPWLVGILARQAARLHRQRGRRPDPSGLERAGEADPLEHAERGELAAQLERGLGELPAPHRAVLERYLAGEKALDIARSSGRAPGTVRMQILRGLERLRRILPAGLYGVVPLARAPRGLAALRMEVVGHGGLALGAGSVVLGSSALGGLLVSTKLVLSLGVAAALTLLFLLRTPRESARAELALEPIPPAELVAAAPPAMLPIPEESGNPIVAGDVRPSREFVAAAPAARPEDGVLDRRTGVFLVGALLGLEGLDPLRTVIAVNDRQGGRQSTTGTADGRYSLEITNLLESGKGFPPALYLDASHPAGRKFALEYPLSDEVRALDHYLRTELSLDLDLEQRTSIVGRVEACSDVDPESVHLALTAATRAEDGSNEWGPVDTCDADAEGRFAFFPRQAGEYRVVACASGVPPVARLVRVAEREVADAGVIGLVPGGVAITGVVRVPFEAEVNFWRVRARRASEPDGAGQRDEGVWNGVRIATDRLEVREGLGQLNTSGAFRIDGLEPGRYDLSLEQNQGPEIVLSYPALTLSAPASGVVLGESYGRTRVHVSGLADQVKLEVRCENGHSTYRRSLQFETCDVIADRRMPFSVSAVARGRRDATAEIPPPRAAEEHMELELGPDDELCALELEWSLPAGFAAPKQVTARWRRGEEEGESSCESNAKSCRFEGLRAGRYRLALEPRGTAPGLLDSSLLFTDAIEVELAPARTVRVQVEWNVGGSAHLVPDATARSAKGLSLGARVEDADGTTLSVRFTQREYRDGIIHMGSWTGGMSIGEPSELQPSLAPGGYELVLSENGVEILRVPFTILAGRTVEVPFVLPP